MENNRKLWNGYLCPLWGKLTHEQIINATDEEIAIWEADFETMKAHNQPIFDVAKAHYRAILDHAKSLWGEDSKEYKYLKKAQVFHHNIDYVIHPERRLADLKRDITNHREKQARAKRESSKQNEAQARREKALVKRVEICVRRGLDSELAFDGYGLQEALLGMDKYLNLAYAMLQTRNDWSDGFGLVRNALLSFKAETPIDNLIVEDIQDCLDSGEYDGRIFRDTTWNYEKLFDMVQDKSLRDDLANIEY